MLALPSKVTVVDVSARDGLQSFHRWVDTDVKVKMVDRLSLAGFPVIEVTNFAHPRVIPHLRDAEEVMARITRRPGVVYRAQAPNARGAERAVAAKAGEILGLITVSEAYNLKNQNMTLEKGVEAALATFRSADAASIPFVMAVGMALYPEHGRDADTLLKHASAQAGSVATLGREGYAAATQRGGGAAANDDAS